MKRTEKAIGIKTAADKTACGSRARRIRVRPHHFLCIRGFEGRGYSKEFVENFERISRSLSEPGLEIEVVEGADDICAACPHLSGDRCLKGEEKASRIDERALRRLGLSLGIATYPEIDKALGTVGPDDILDICSDCDWLEMGYCAKAFDKS